MLSDKLDNGRTDDNAIGNARDVGGLFWGADAKAYGDGKVGVRFEARDSFIDAGLCCDL